VITLLGNLVIIKSLMDSVFHTVMSTPCTSLNDLVADEYDSAYED
jgi:hypothetical protein